MSRTEFYVIGRAFSHSSPVYACYQHLLKMVFEWDDQMAFTNATWSTGSLLVACYILINLLGQLIWKQVEISCCVLAAIVLLQIIASGLVVQDHGRVGWFGPSVIRDWSRPTVSAGWYTTSVGR